MNDELAGTDRLRWWAEILTPTGILIGLLYYFGYVTTYAWFQFFGLELSLVDLPQQAIVLQSVAALYLPVGALVTLGVFVYVARRGVLTLLGRGWRPATMRVGGFIAVGVGAALIVRALVGIFVPDVSRTEPIATSPLSLCAGTLLMVGGFEVVGRTGESGRPPHRPTWSTVLAVALVVLGLFWATNSVAAAYGRGRAQAFADTLPRRPAVVLDTPERLFLASDRVEETALSDEQGAAFRYRYRNLRLLAASQGRLYLAPDDWRRGAGTVVVLQADQVRMQFLR